MRKIGINLLTKDNDGEYVKKIASLGFTATFTGTYDTKRHMEIAEACCVNGIEYETIHAPFSNINDIWLDRLAGDTMLDRLFDCVDKCSRSNVEIIVVHLSSGVKAPLLPMQGGCVLQN